MIRYLIEISRRADGRSERQIDEAIRALGSHFVTHADWRVKGGIVVGSMIAEAENSREALALVPPI